MSNFWKYGETWDAWMQSVHSTLVSDYGIEKDFGEKLAVFLAYLFIEKLNPVITSGYRSKEHQEKIRQDFINGKTQGLVVKPAVDSKHTTTDFLGNPAALAIDIQTSNQARAAQIATFLGIQAGLNFKKPDPVHFQRA